MNVHMCWATLNLLKKFAELGHVIVDIGRYYQEYVIAMVSTIRVLSFDIRVLLGKCRCCIKEWRIT